VQSHDRSHGRGYVDFNFGDVEELIQNEAFQDEEGQHGQENDEHAVEEHCLEGAVVLRVLEIKNKQGISQPASGVYVLLTCDCCRVCFAVPPLPPAAFLVLFDILLSK